MADQAVRDSARVVQTTNPLSPNLANAILARRIARDVVARFLEAGEVAALEYAQREIALALLVAAGRRALINDDIAALKASQP
jgi:hypothetical protein